MGAWKLECRWCPPEKYDGVLPQDVSCDLIFVDDLVEMKVGPNTT